MMINSVYFLFFSSDGLTREKKLECDKRKKKRVKMKNRMQRWLKSLIGIKKKILEVGE